jgi:hypothetical protein
MGAVQRLRATHRDGRRAFAEGQGDRPGLGHVADRRRGRVGAHVVDLGRVHARIVEGDGRRPRRLGAVRPRLDHVVRVRRRPVAEELRVRHRAAALRDLGRLQHQQCGALAHDEPVPSHVERPGCRVGRVVVAGRQRADDVERTKRQGLSGISQPPAIAASTRPSRRSPNASPRATAPEAHEFAVDRIGPRTSSAIPRLAGAAPPNTASARFGATWRMPRSRYRSCCSSA